MLQFRLGMDGLCRSTKQGGLSFAPARFRVGPNTCFSTAAASAASRTPARCFVFYSNSFAKAIWWWMLLCISLRKVTRTNMRKNMYVVTPRCAAAAAAAVVSAVVLRRPTKEYTHPYSMMHRRLPTAGIEVAPRYPQLLVYIRVIYMPYDIVRHELQR